MKSIFFLLTMLTISLTCSAQKRNESHDDDTWLERHFERRWSLDPIESPISSGKNISISFTAINGGIEIFVVDGQDRKVHHFRNLTSSGVVELPGNLLPGNYHVIMIGNSRRVARQVFTVVSNQAQ
jgi:hypothetical protein